ncbi:MAG: hypothetical protein QW468_03880 [Candidatus Bathyarchaeia archaeon]
MAMQRISLGALLAIAAVGVIASALGALMASYTFNNTATVRAAGVSVYWYSNRTSPVTAIDWGNIAPGETATKTIYLYNNGTIAVKLSMTTGQWSPATAANYITVNWNCTGQILSPGAVVCAALTLNVSQNISGITSFSFNIVITGTEQ